MSHIFKHNGKCGDLIFSLPAIKALGGGTAYLPKDGAESQGLLDNLKPLLDLQPYITEVREYPSGLGYMELVPGIHIDYDLDRARLQKAKGIKHIIRWYLEAFNVELPNWKEPWLTIDETMKGEYSIINYTGRHIVNKQTGQQSKVNWKKVVAGIEGQVYFVGTPSEYKWFADNIAPVRYLHTANTLDLARVIAGAKAVYCNQSCCLALAQGLGVPYYLDVKPGKTNCLLRTEKENIL